MIRFVLISVITLVIGLASCPLLAYLRARRKYGQVEGRSRTILNTYYSVMGVCVLLITGGLFIPGAVILGFIALVAVFFAVLAGPFVALDVATWMRELRVDACSRCGYNLTGNVSGVCPECGTKIGEKPSPKPGLRQRFRSVKWRKFLPLYLAALLLLTLLLGYERATTAWYCTQCAKHEYRILHIVSVPFGGPQLFEFDGGLRTEWQRTDPLTAYLDPDGSCTHQWRGYGWDGEGFSRGWRGIGSDPCSIGTLPYEPDFGQFIAAQSDVLDRIRADLRQRRNIANWLVDEYDAWKQSAANDD